MNITDEPIIGLALTEGDKAHVTWVKIKRHLDARKQELLAKLAGDMPEEQTWKMRGRIAEINAMLEADKTAPIVESDFK